MIGGSVSEESLVLCGQRLLLLLGGECGRLCLGSGGYGWRDWGDRGDHGSGSGMMRGEIG